ncbi:MAG TPA: YHS domain-containing protein [Dehalococcoidia bacterium]|jgi:YHS domain-containing protein|nr:YHS domain-containing protein [Dehalococcoidia bacterium]
MSNLDLIFGENAIDPICNMVVNKLNPPGGEYKFEGQTYFFCAISCQIEFSQNPTKYT